MAGREAGAPRWDVLDAYRAGGRRRGRPDIPATPDDFFNRPADNERLVGYFHATQEGRALRLGKRGRERPFPARSKRGGSNCQVWGTGRHIQPGVLMDFGGGAAWQVVCGRCQRWVTARPGKHARWARAAEGGISREPVRSAPPQIPQSSGASARAQGFAREKHGFEARARAARRSARSKTCGTICTDPRSLRKSRASRRSNTMAAPVFNWGKALFGLEYAGSERSGPDEHLPPFSSRASRRADPSAAPTKTSSTHSAGRFRSAAFGQADARVQTAFTAKALLQNL